jgi:hypothetical protein
MGSYFKPRRDAELEAVERFTDIVRQYSLTNNTSTTPITAGLQSDVVGHTLFLLGEIGGSHRRIVFIEYNKVTAIVSVRFKIDFDETKLPGLSSGTSPEKDNQLILNFDCFNENTEKELGNLIKDYFERGVDALKDVMFSGKREGT